jgi:hypothetical protein
MFKKRKFIMIIILKEEEGRKERFLKNLKIRVLKRKIYLNIEFNLVQENLKSQNPFKDQEIININTIKSIISITRIFHMQEMQEIDLTQEIHQEVD